MLGVAAGAVAEGEAAGAEEASDDPEGDADEEGFAADFADVVLDFAAARESVR